MASSCAVARGSQREVKIDLAWWIAVIGVPLVGAIFGVDFYIHRNADTERERLAAELANVKAAFNDYRVNAASLYATTVAVGEMRRELVAVVTRIEDKLDRIAERNDRRDRN